MKAATRGKPQPSKSPNARPLLAQVYQSFKPAIPVWAALSDLAASKKRNAFAARRSILSRMSGVQRVASISMALSVLEEHGIIARKIKRCRRPDGTMFHRLRVKLLHRIAGSATIHQSAPPELKSAPIYVRNQGAKSATHLKRDVCRCGTHTATARDVATSAEATVAPSRAEHSSQMTLPNHWQPMRNDLVALLRKVCVQIGCRPNDFMQRSSNLLRLQNYADPKMPELQIHTQLGPAMADFATRNPEWEVADWIGSSEQVAAMRQVLEARSDTPSPKWHTLSNKTRETASELANKLRVALTDFDQDDSCPEYLTLGRNEQVGDLWLDIDERGKVSLQLIVHEDEETEMEPWTGSSEQMKRLEPTLSRLRSRCKTADRG